MSAVKFLSVAIIVVTIQVVNITAMDPKCKGVDIKLSEEQIMGIKECIKVAGITSKENLTPEQIGCMAKCIMEKKGTVDDKGKPHKEKMNNFIDAVMPDAAKADLKMALEKCLDSEGGKINPGECISYTPLATCAHKAFVELCA